MTRFLSPNLQLLLACIGTLSPFLTHAQVATDRNSAIRQSESIQRQNQERAQRDIEDALRPAQPSRGQATDNFLPPFTAPTIGVTCRTVDSVVIDNAPNLAPSIVTAISQDMVNKCVGVNEIEKILARVTKAYIDTGFITTRIYLPSQDLGSRVLRFTVLEGKIERIEINDDDSKSVLPVNVFPAGKGDLLNLRDLEQGIDQINRLSSNSATLDMQPGLEPGGTVVIVNNKPTNRLHFSSNLDNQGSLSTGRDELGLSLTADHLLGLNELLAMTRRESQFVNRQVQFATSDNFSFAIPFGYTTLSLSANRSKYLTSINAPSGLVLKSTGTSSADNVRVDRVMYRDQDTRLTLSGSLTFKESRNFLGEEFLEVSSRKLTVLDASASVSTVIFGGALSASVGIVQGLKAGAALQDLPDLPDFAPRAQFEKLTYSASYAKSLSILGMRGSLSTQLTGQEAKTTLYGSEQIGIGGIYSVRGFYKNSLAGDSGYYLRNELSITPKMGFMPEGLATRFYIGLDVGEVKNRAEGIPQGQLVGMALGFNAQWKNFSLDIFHAHPVSAPSFMTLEQGQTWARMSLAF